MDTGISRDDIKRRMDLSELRASQIEQNLETIMTMLGHLVHKPSANEPPPDHDPFIHVIAGDEKWNICLSRAGKWVAGIIAVLIPMAIAGAFTFAYTGAQGMAEVKTELKNINRRLDSMSDYIMAVDSRVNGKVDK
jgi:hypothetical protein